MVVLARLEGGEISGPSHQAVSFILPFYTLGHLAFRMARVGTRVHKDSFMALWCLLLLIYTECIMFVSGPVMSLSRLFADVPDSYICLER